MVSAYAWSVALAGFAIGGVAGFVTQRSRLCSFGAIEDATVAGDTRRIRIFGLALGIAILFTQTLIVAGYLKPTSTNYITSAIPWIGLLFGGLIFGLGMALVGTCSFGSLVRLGSGDLRSLVVVLVFAATALAILRGVLSGVRLSVFEAFPIRFASEISSDLPSVLGQALHADLRLPLSIAIGGLLISFAAFHPRLRKSPRLLGAGVTLGLCIGLGWLATTILADEFDGPSKPQSLTFVAPVGRAIFGALLAPTTLIEFGVGSVLGVIAGSWLSAMRSNEFRWEAFDDQREMRRHLGGAALMGFGGILAGGCTIGQGLTAGSLLALSWPLAVAGMIVGARLGIVVLFEGSFRELVRRFL
jgi:uncharacterized membrane protein YedE/YeeE